MTDKERIEYLEKKVDILHKMISKMLRYGDRYCFDLDILNDQYSSLDKEIIEKIQNDVYG